MVIVDQARCIACGQCVHVCHEGCMALEDGVLHVDHDLCSTCTQCIAICPALALSWDGEEPLPCEDGRLPSPEQLNELFKQRRTVRRFKADPVDRALLQEIAAYGIYAPTNHYRLRALLIDDPYVLAELQAIGLQALRRVYNVFYRFRPVFALLTRLTPAMQEKDKVKLEACLADDDGRHNAAVGVEGHGPLGADGPRAAAYVVKCLGDVHTAWNGVCYPQAVLAWVVRARAAHGVGRSWLRCNVC